MSNKTAADLHQAPERRSAPRTLGASWGDAGHSDPMHNGKGAWEEFLHDSPDVLEKCFSGYGEASKKDKSFVDSLFEAKEYTAHSPLLRKYAESGEMPSYSTLQERVIALTGRR